MSDVRVLALGVGDAFSARHYTTCLALGAGDSWLLIDCPHPVRKLLREGATAAGLTLDVDKVSGVALTHLHADHASGLESWAFYLYFVLGRKADVLAHPDVTRHLWDGLLRGGMGEVWLDPAGPPETRTLPDFFDVTHLREDAPVSFGPFSVECRRTNHLIPTTAFRITAHGRVLGFSADTTYDPGLIDWLAPADLIIHEVTNLPESPVHTPYARLAALPEPLRRKMRLTHYPDAFDPDASGIEALREGRVYAV